MKTDDCPIFARAFNQILSRALVDAAHIHLAPPNRPTDKLPPGAHSHDTWELFCALQPTLNFCSVGQPITRIPPRHLLLVPPGCLHVRVDNLPQSPKLSVLVLTLSSQENYPVGALRVTLLGRHRVMALSAADLVAWTDRLGIAPARLLERVAPALAEGRYARDRALAWLRLLLATCAEVVTHPERAHQSAGASRVAETHIFLQSQYYDPTLTVASIAKELGVSASHLTAVFRQVTGRSVNQTLIEIRLQRATDLLMRNTHSIKEISDLTGWSNQLYFSAAYRRRFGHPPSAARIKPS